MTYSMGNQYQNIIRANRSGKATISKQIMQLYLDRGDHVHSASPGNHICYNGGPDCLPHVQGQQFTGPKAVKGTDDEGGDRTQV